MDLSEQISSLLNSPDGMDKLRSAAATLLGNGAAETAATNEENKTSIPDFSGGMSENIGNITSVIKTISALKSTKEDDRICLLKALKPHLSNERAAKVDKAVYLLKIAAVIPVLRKEGLMDDLLGGIL